MSSWGKAEGRGQGGVNQGGGVNQDDGVLRHLVSWISPSHGLTSSEDRGVEMQDTELQRGSALHQLCPPWGCAPWPDHPDFWRPSSYVQKRRGCWME